VKEAASQVASSASLPFRAILLWNVWMVASQMLHQRFARYDRGIMWKVRKSGFRINCSDKDAKKTNVEPLQEP